MSSVVAFYSLKGWDFLYFSALNQYHTCHYVNSLYNRIGDLAKLLIFSDTVRHRMCLHLKQNP